MGEDGTKRGMACGKSHVSDRPKVYISCSPTGRVSTLSAPLATCSCRPSKVGEGHGWSWMRETQGRSRTSSAADVCVGFAAHSGGSSKSRSSMVCCLGFGAYTPVRSPRSSFPNLTPQSHRASQSPSVYECGARGPPPSHRASHQRVYERQAAATGGSGALFEAGHKARIRQDDRPAPLHEAAGVLCRIVLVLHQVGDTEAGGDADKCEHVRLVRGEATRKVNDKLKGRLEAQVKDASERRNGRHGLFAAPTWPSARRRESSG